MGRQIQHGDTLFGLAYEMLGDGRATDQLVIDGWNGDPSKLPVGAQARTKFEKPGPPARWAADPQRLGSHAQEPDQPQQPQQGQGKVIGIDAAGNPIHG